jgi:hypothetical protein
MYISVCCKLDCCAVSVLEARVVETMPRRKLNIVVIYYSNI